MSIGQYIIPTLPMYRSTIKDILNNHIGKKLYLPAIKNSLHKILDSADLIGLINFKVEDSYGNLTVIFFRDFDAFELWPNLYQDQEYKKYIQQLWNYYFKLLFNSKSAIESFIEFMMSINAYESSVMSSFLSCYK